MQYKLVSQQKYSNNVQYRDIHNRGLNNDLYNRGVHYLMDNFKLRYPEFNDVPEAVVAMAIDDAAMELCQKVWGKYYERGVSALAAHNLWLKGYLDDIDEDTGLPDSDGGAKRAVASHTAGSLSISYAGTAKDGFGNGNTYGFEDSVYGREYLRLMNLVSPRWVVIR